MKWKAAWIWTDGEPTPQNAYLYARRSFVLDCKADRSITRVCADSRYILWVNGRFVARGPARSDPRWQSYDVVDIAPYLHKGQNVVAMLAHHYGQNTFSYMLGRAALLFDCTVRPASGKKIDISSGPAWRVLRSDAWEGGFGRMDAQLGYHEVFHPSREPKGWREPGFDDSRWEAATVVDRVGEGPWRNLTPRDIPFQYQRLIFPEAVIDSGVCDASAVTLPEDDQKDIARIMHEETITSAPKDHILHPEALIRRPCIEDIMASRPLNPRGITRASLDKEIASGKPSFVACTIKALKPGQRGAGKGVYLVFDFGREVMGHPVIKVAGSQGGALDIGYSELLEDGRVNPYRGQVRYADRIYLHGGPEQWESFDLRAFRYMEVDITDCPGPVVLESVGLVFTTYPVEWRGWVETPDEMLNRIWEMGAYTVQLNMEDSFTDCPWCERTQWWGDARIEALTSYYAFGDTKLIRQGIKQIAQSQHPDGMTQCFYPGVWDSTIPGFCLIWVLSVEDYYQWTGDKQTVKALYPNVKKALEWFEDKQQPDGLVGGTPYWNFYDWADIDLSGPNTLMNAFFAGALEAGSRLALAAGDTATSRHWLDDRARVIAATNARLWNADKGVYADCVKDNGVQSSVISQQSNSAAILFGVAPADKAQGILDYIYNGKNTVVQSGSPYFSFYLLQALWRSGRSEQALDYIRTMWGAMVKEGATTFWEHWTQSNSLCHGWSSGPTHDMGAWLLGVQPAKPGSKVIRVAPETGGLPWAKGVVPTVQGDVAVSWKVTESSFALEMKAPKSSKIELLLPTFGKTAGELTINGKKSVKGAKSVGVSGDHIKVMLDKGGAYALHLALGGTER